MVCILTEQSICLRLSLEQVELLHHWHLHQVKAEKHFVLCKDASRNTWNLMMRNTHICLGILFLGEKFLHLCLQKREIL